ncbi:hypothetical protein GCM10008098_19570 [Rhodanobacter panaciterrae]|uniref:Uncharacterized protein n=1 Tax=Rhodanobacter panaciterrae TaxID=490572 RepID=A0ABQ2ZYG6_9GAMM|nr:hypothetical protein GCM10008098_19570 [Rhodanobacter panaciterrae]
MPVTEVDSAFSKAACVVVGAHAVAAWPLIGLSAKARAMGSNALLQDSTADFSFCMRLNIFDPQKNGRPRGDLTAAASFLICAIRRCMDVEMSASCNRLAKRIRYADGGVTHGFPRNVSMNF